MSEDTTQETTVEAPQGQVETVATEGVEDKVDAQSGTDTNLQSPDILDKDAEVSLFQTLKAQKGWESEEDLAKAYKEAEGELTRRSQALSKTQEDYAAMESVLEGLINGDIVPNEVAEDDYQPDPTYDRLRKLEAKTDVRSVAERHQDFAEIQPVMSEILNSTENKAVFQGEKGVELLYKMAKAEKLEAELANAKKQGANEVTLAEVEKVRATVAGGTKAKNSSYNRIFSAAEVAAMDDSTYMANREEILKQQREGLIK
jgi:hypothetical protein